MASRFSGRVGDVTDAFAPMLRRQDRRTLATMITVAEEFIRTVFQPTEDDESEYLSRATRAGKLQFVKKSTGLCY